MHAPEGDFMHWVKNSGICKKMIVKRKKIIIFAKSDFKYLFLIFFKISVIYSFFSKHLFVMKEPIYKLNNSQKNPER